MSISKSEVTQNFPITVGVVGHLDVVETENLKNSILAFFKALVRNYPNSTIIINTLLAKGADQLVPRILKESNCEELNQLKFEVHNISRLFDINSNTTRASSNESIEKEYYRKCGKFIVDHSLIVLTLWNGNPKCLIGGTADLVHYTHIGTFDTTLEYIEDPKQNMVHLLCKRAKNKDHIESDCICIVPPDSLPKDLGELLRRNKGIATTLDKIEEINTCIKKNQVLSKPYHSTFESNFNLLDSLAQIWKRKYTLTVKILLIFSAIILAAMEIAEGIDHISRYPLFAILIFGFIITIFNVFKLNKSHQTYIELRLLSEALRVQYNWYKNDINLSVSDNILKIHETEVNWIKNFLSSLYGVASFMDLDAPTELNSSYWIKSQKDFFKKRLDDFDDQNKSSKHFSIGLLVISVLIIAAFTLYRDSQISGNIINDFSLSTITILLGFTLLMKTYYNKMGYNQLQNQYKLMLSIYSHAEKKIQFLDSRNLEDDVYKQKLKSILVTTGKEALIEIGNWYLIYKDKEPEFEGF